MQDVLAKLKEIQENYDNEDIQRAITAAEKTAMAEETVEEETVEEAMEDGKTYAWINVETGDHGYGTKEESSKWTHYIPMSDFSYFSGDEDYKGLDDETAQEQGWIAVEESVEEAEKVEQPVAEEDSVEEVHQEEVVEESVDNSGLERMIKLSGRSGVMGMNTNVIVAESVEVVEDEVSEEAFIAKEADEDDEDDEEEVDESFETVEEETVEEDTVEVPVSALQELMKLAGYEEFKIDEYANEPEEDYMSAEYQMDLGGGLNGPKKAYAAAAGGDNPMDQEATEIEEDNKLTFEGMYKRYMNQVVEETLEEKE